MDDEHLRLFLTEEQLQQIKTVRKQVENIKNFHYGLGMVVAVLGVWGAWLLAANLYDNESIGPGIAIGSFILGLYYMWKGKPYFDGK